MLWKPRTREKIKRSMGNGNTSMNYFHKLWGIKTSLSETSHRKQRSIPKETSRVRLGLAWNVYQQTKWRMWQMQWKMVQRIDQDRFDEHWAFWRRSDGISKIEHIRNETSRDIMRVRRIIMNIIEVVVRQLKNGQQKMCKTCVAVNPNFVKNI